MNVSNRLLRLKTDKGTSVIELLIYIAIASTISMLGFWMLMAIWDTFAAQAKNSAQQNRISLVKNIATPIISSANSGSVGLIKGEQIDSTSLGGDQFVVSLPYKCYRFFYVKRLEQLRMASMNYSCTEKTVSAGGIIPDEASILPVRGPNETVSGVGATGQYKGNNYRTSSTDNIQFDPVLDALPDLKDSDVQNGQTGSEPALDAPLTASRSNVIVERFTLSNTYSNASVEYTHPFVFKDISNSDLGIPSESSADTENPFYESKINIHKIALIQIRGFLGSLSGDAATSIKEESRKEKIDMNISLGQVCPENME